MKNPKRMILSLIAMVLVTMQPIWLSAHTPEASPALSSTCLDQGIEQKDSYLIGVSQANKGEPMATGDERPDRCRGRAIRHLEVVFADAAQDNAKQVADVEGFIEQGVDLLIISPNEAAPLTDVGGQGLRCRNPCDRARPQGEWRSVHDVDWCR